MNVKSSETSTKSAVMALFLLITGLAAVSPALENIMQAFPEASIRSIYLILTLPTLVVIPVSAIVGNIGGRRISFRMLVLLGTMIFSVAGLIPYFLDSIPAILVSRAFFGIGVGIITPMGTTLTFLLFDKKDSPKLLGRGNVFTNLGAIIFSMGGALLCAINWRMTFLIYLLGFVVMIIVAFMLPEPEMSEKVKEEEEAVEDDMKMPTKVYLYSILFGVSVMLVYPQFLNFSTIIIQENIGNAATAGTLITLGTVSGMVVGALFGKIYKITQQFTMAVAAVTGLIASFLTYIGKDIITLAFAFAFTGICMTMLTVATTINVGAVCTPKTVAKGTGIAMAFLSIGSFAATFYTSSLATVPGQDPVRFVFLVSTIAFAAMTVLQIIINIKKRVAIEN